jgi:hypothetical protein
MELFTATGKQKVFFLRGGATRDVRCVHHGWHGTHRYDIQFLATHASTWVHRHSSLLQWSVPLGQRGHVAMVGRILCTKCTLHSNHRLTVWYSNAQNDFSPGAAIFSLHTLASPSGRNMNYDEKQLTGKKELSFSFYLYRFRKYMSYGFPIINFCNPGVHYETPCILHLIGPYRYSPMLPPLGYLRLQFVEFNTFATFLCARFLLLILQGVSSQYENKRRWQVCCKQLPFLVAYTNFS